jgi:hypothetical protein
MDIEAIKPLIGKRVKLTYLLTNNSEPVYFTCTILEIQGTDGVKIIDRYNTTKTIDSDKIVFIDHLDSENYE